jgi:hypothetical protein
MRVIPGTRPLQTAQGAGHPYVERDWASPGVILAACKRRVTRPPRHSLTFPWRRGDLVQ